MTSRAPDYVELDDIEGISGPRSGSVDVRGLYNDTEEMFEVVEDGIRRFLRAAEHQLHLERGGAPGKTVTGAVANASAAAGGWLGGLGDKLGGLGDRVRGGARDLKNSVDATIKDASDLKGVRLGLNDKVGFSLPPVGAYLLGWSALIGTQAAFSLPGYKEKVAEIFGSDGNVKAAYTALSTLFAGFLTYYYTKEGRFLGGLISPEVPKLVSNTLKMVGVLFASQALVNYAPSFAEIQNGETSLLSAPKETRGALRITRFPILWALGTFGLGKALELRNKGSWLFYGFFPVYAAIAGYLHDEREGVTDSTTSILPFKAIADGTQDLKQALGEFNWPAAAVTVALSLKRLFPDVYSAIRSKF